MKTSFNITYQDPKSLNLRRCPEPSATPTAFNKAVITSRKKYMVQTLVE
jgi:hypothetical protein